MSSSDSVLVVPAKLAWPQYIGFAEKYPKYGQTIYQCQPGRKFKHVGSGDITRIAFYTNGAIQRYVPTILGSKMSKVQFDPSRHSGKLRDLIEWLLQEPLTGKVNDVYWLSSPDSPDTIDLKRVVPHKSPPNAFAYGHRYVSLEKLQSAKHTGDL